MIDFFITDFYTQYWVNKGSLYYWYCFSYYQFDTSTKCHSALMALSKCSTL